MTRVVSTSCFTTISFDALISSLRWSTTSTISAVWAIATHFHQAFVTFPFLKFEGPPGCGKTTANWTVACASFHPIPTPDISDAGFYRIRESVNGTVALDERDFMKQTESRFDDFLNNSFTKGGYVIRIEKDANGLLFPDCFASLDPSHTAEWKTSHT